MEICAKCHQSALGNLMQVGMYPMVDASKQDLVEKLKARIMELEFELQMQRTAAEKGEKLLKVMWGDDFHDESLF